jgi:glutathione synthase/RimK-type ligase-like ATP-grasp enzyme
MGKIYIRKSSSWEESRERLIKYLGEYHSPDYPFIILNFSHNYRGGFNKIVLNRDVERQKDKIKMNKLLDELQIPHPKTYYYPFYNLPKTPEECIIKNRFSERGNGIRFGKFLKVRKEEYLLSNENKYIQAFVPFEKEYRVIVDFLGVIGIKEKRLRSYYSHRKYKNSSTCQFKKIKNEEVEKFALYVASKFQIDFSGIDVGEWMGRYYVIEFNSAPSLCSEFAEIFANHLIGLCEENE